MNSKHGASKYHILIVDDDSRILSLLSRYLSNNDYLVTLTKDTIEAREALKLFNFDLIILDVMLPNETGMEFANKLRRISEVAILMLTAMGSTQDRISGLKSGADDYLAKPFEPQELLLRIKKLILRTQHTFRKNENIIRLGRAQYDIDKKVLIDQGTLIPVSSSELKALRILIDDRNKIVSRERLAKELKINLRSVDVLVTRLRRRIEYNSQKPALLQAVRGLGYVLYAD